MAQDPYQGSVAADPDRRLTGTPAERSARDELRRRQETMVRVVLRPIGCPLALGFVALAAATLVVSGLQLSWVQPAEGRNVALILIGFVVPLQLLASVLGFLARDSLAGTAMGILSGSWLAVGLVLLTSPPGSTSDALGLFLLVAGTAMLLPATAALATKLVPALVLATTALRFLVTGLYQLTASSAWKAAAGLVGLLLAALAMYAAWAFELEDTAKRTVLPTLRRGKGPMRSTRASSTRWPRSTTRPESDNSSEHHPGPMGASLPTTGQTSGGIARPAKCSGIETAAD